MPRFAVKRLTKSDITIIARHYRARKAAGDTTAQKSIALPRRVFIDRFYPRLPWINEIAPFTMTVIGPGATPPFEAAATITKTIKNWRLNGFFKDPLNRDDAWNIPDRFSGMLPPPGHMEQDVEAYVRANNIAIIEFPLGNAPTGGRIAFVSRPVLGDEILFESLSRLLANQSMVEIHLQTLSQIFHLARIPTGHPIWMLTEGRIREGFEPIGAVDEAAALGVGEAIKTIRAEQKGRGRRPVTAAQHDRWRAAAELSGRWGEKLAWHHLIDLEERGEFHDLVWSSVEEDFYSPFDFRALERGSSVFFEVKSTFSGFNTPINMSIGELEQAASGRGRYTIFRFYNVTNRSGLLRICPDIGNFAKQVLASLQGTWNLGVSVDKLSFLPDLLGFGREEFSVILPENPEDGGGLN